MLTSLIPSTSTVSPVTVSWARQRARITNTFDDNILGENLIIATEMVENYLSRYLLTRTATWTVSDDSGFGRIGAMYTMMPWQWSSFIRQPSLNLPRPCQTVSTVSVGIWANPEGSADQTLVLGTDYVLDLAGSVGRIRWLTNAYQNMLRDHISVTFTSGYGATRDDVPMPILQAISLITTNLMYFRGDVEPEIFSSAVKSLLNNYRYVYFA